MPPGATGSRPPRATGSTSPASSHVNNYPRATLDALLNAPTRESQPHLHPYKINGALCLLVRKTHMRKDGTYVDPRAESLVTEVEEVATQLTTEDGSPNGLSQAASSVPSRILLNKEYVKCGKTKRGCIYGIGSVQFRDITPSETVSASLNRNLDMEMRISGLEHKFKTVNDNVEVVKEDLVALKADLKAGIDSMKDEMSETRVALKAIMLSLGINLQQQVTQTQPSQTQPSVHGLATNPTVY